ncbi:MAG: aryl-sulfate sulfotransferase [Planctomycetota bacterium]
MYRRKLTDDVTVHDPSKAFEGYTFFAPTFEKVAWLVDMQGRVVHRWEMETAPASHGKLLPNGHVMWQGKGPGSIADFVGSGSELVEVDWDGNKVWRYEEVGLNHDFLVLDDDRLIINVFTPIPGDRVEDIQGGIPGTELRGQIWTCCLKEISRVGEVLWEFNVAEHLDLEDDVLCPLCPRHVWGFCNSLARLPDGNILFPLRLLNDLAVLDPEKGEIVWRLGKDKELGHPHSCSVLPNGNFLLYDNGLHRVGADPELQIADISASRLVEIDPETREIVWQYMDPFAPNFYSAICSSAQRLPNGNTLICEATKGRLFEVTKEKEIVWEYHSPFLVTRPSYWGWTLAKTIWDAQRYAPDYPAFDGKDLDPENYEFVIRRRGEAEKREEAELKRLKSLGY